MNICLRVKLTSVFTALLFSILFIAFFVSDASAQSVQNATGYINSKNGVNVRNGTSVFTKKVMVLSNNKKVTITEVVFSSRFNGTAKDKWYHINYGGKSGYVRSDLINRVEYSAVTGRTTASVNSRLGAGTGFTRITTFGNNVNLTILLKARANNSNVGWYMIKYNGGYNYVCASWVNITGSIFSNNSGGTSNNGGINSPIVDPKHDSKPTHDNINSSQNKPTTGTNSTTTNNSDNSNNTSTTKQSESDFEKSISSFPEDYKVKLRQLHAAHPNWKFVAKNTGIDWNTALSKESRDGVSLINGAYPLSYRDVNSYSFKAKDKTRPLYKKASKSSDLAGTASANTDITILDEMFINNNGSDDAKFVHVKTAAGQTGYIQGSVTNENYSAEVNGTVKGGYTNIRKGAGTGYSKVGGVNTGNKVAIVLTAKASDGVIWYKIKNGSGFAYICSKFVTVEETKTATVASKQAATPKASNSNNSSVVYGTIKQNTAYRMGPSDLFKEVGGLTTGQNVTIIDSVKNVDNSSWYKVAINGKVYYVPSEAITASGEVRQGNASVSGKVHDYLNYRASYDLTNKPVGTFSKNTEVVITGVINSGNYNWYRIQYKGTTYYAAANWITITDQKYDGQEATAPVEKNKESEEHAVVGIESLKGVGRFTASGTYIPKDGATWFNANTEVVGYYMDPRNFLNENNIYMFEDLSYQSYQSQAAVSKIISGTALERNGFMASWFVTAGQQNGISPIALAARARQETGGGSIAISGYVFPDGKSAYNPYNIGAYSNANPVMRGLEYAKKQGWDTKQKAVFGGAKFIASGYIKQGQNSVYFQRFNVANGASKVGTHQYMTNISACYTESISTKNSYSAYGITNESLVFIIPIYSNMPSATALPH
ncbi:SH3 domain-containing protein [Mogibacterium pumilum]|uniref:SH3b domain-containing protein n=1 Tax=Mogibacterium pumilum TaxID=86332 RepID=A0A223ASW6_9FIRM|nr:SH3 domain-containing protein [Mogibacterium pumilum]ASS38067.1 hypothetical protein AXF17_06280 [Mogibacterium pumilum]